MSVVKIRQALETGLLTMPGMIPIATSSVATSTVITTPSAHGLATGMVVYIKGHTGSTPSIDGSYVVTVLTTTTFSIPKTVTIAGTGGAFTLTAWENVNFTPPAPSIPYQQAFILWAEPENPEFGSGYRQSGIFQISLRYPASQGINAAAARAELIKSYFYRGVSFIKDSVIVTIEKTPEVGQGKVDGDRFFIPVRIRFYSNVL